MTLQNTYTNNIFFFDVTISFLKITVIMEPENAVIYLGMFVDIVFDLPYDVFYVDRTNSCMIEEEINYSKL